MEMLLSIVRKSLLGYLFWRLAGAKAKQWIVATDDQEFRISYQALSPLINLPRTLGIEYESAISIFLADGLLELSRFPRHFFKSALYTLKPGGTLVWRMRKESSFFESDLLLRQPHLIMLEYSLSIGQYFEVENIKKTDNFVEVTARKMTPALEHDDTIERWTFGIISNGSDESISLIRSICDQIHSLNISEFEILICGPSEKLKSLGTGFYSVIPDDDIRTLRAPISTKKNRIVSQARYSNVALLHDRISFSKDWHLSMQQYGNYFDLVGTTILDLETKRFHVKEWLKLQAPLSSWRGARGVPIDRQDWAADLYIDGGLIVAKRRLLRRVKFDERLHWNECEDVIFAQHSYLDGALLTHRSLAVNYTIRGRVRTSHSLIDRFLRTGIKIIRASYRKFLFALPLRPISVAIEKQNSAKATNKEFH